MSADEQKGATLYTLAVSPNSHGILSLIAQNKLPIANKSLDPMKGETRTPEFLAKNPFHCCPTLEDGDFVLWESNSVLRYAADSNGLEAEYPKDPKKRAKIDQALDWRQTSMYKATAGVAYPLFGWGPAFANADAEAAAKKTCDAAMKELVDHYLDGGKHKFIGGSDTPTLADYAVATIFSLLGIDAEYNAALPKEITDYVARFTEAVPSYAETRAPLDGYIGYLHSQKKEAPKE